MNEKAVLVAIEMPKESRADAALSFDELKHLAYTAGAQVIDQKFQHLKEIHPKYFIGKGKAEEIAESLKISHPDLVIFDHDLTPAQQSHLEELLEVRVVDRTGIILDIFAQRAKSKEGKLQVELAQLHYLYPRLKGHGVMLSRLGGGIGTRGPGEMKLEMDRRRIRDRISQLNREIKLLEKNRAMRREKRQSVPLPIITLVGYTNAGKSTLLNALTEAKVLAEDKLFATLDPTTRQLILPNHQHALVTDTVGFIQKLPVELVKAFKATLEEVTEADLIIHVIDLSHPEFEKQQNEVIKILDFLEASHKPILYVYNKIDVNLDYKHLFLTHRRLHPCVMISAEQKTNFPELLEKIQNLLSHFIEKVDIIVPLEDQKTLASIHEQGKVIEKKYLKTSVRVIAEVPPKFANWLKKQSGIKFS